jgi:hypothetical protein
LSAMESIDPAYNLAEKSFSVILKESR